MPLSGIFKYSFQRDNSITISSLTVPIISGPKLSYTISSVDNNAITGIVTVIINWVINSSNYDDINLTEGLSFKKTSLYVNEKQIYNKKNVNIIQFGGIPLSRSGYQFYDLRDLQFTANDSPTIVTNTSLDYCFSGKKVLSIFNENINNWNTRNVISMKGTFSGAIKFNKPLNNWDVNNVTDVSEMFMGAIDFNQPLNNWNVNNITNFCSMFESAESFNQNLSNWKIKDDQVNILNIFTGAKSFNNGANNGDSSNSLGDNWLPLKNYEYSYRELYCPLTNENASPLYVPIVPSLSEPTMIINNDNNPVKLSLKSLGKKRTFNIKVTSNSSGSITYKSSNTNIAVVNNAGIVTIKKQGNVHIIIEQQATNTYKYVKEIFVMIINA